MKKVLVLVWILCTLGLGAEDLTLLNQGKDYYSRGEFVQALTLFQKAVSDPQLRNQPLVYLWLSKTYFALLDYNGAARNLDYYLQNFPKDGGQEEGRYLQARILFSQGEYEKAILAFSSFMTSFPASEQTSNAVFWIAESAFALGHYDEAASLYSRIIKAYPASYKVEASRYRLAVIELRQREEELTKLLRWSQVESLNAADEFQRREKAYQQALLSYQKKILDLQAGDLGAQITALQDEIRQKDAQISALKVQLAAGAGTKTVTAVPDNTQQAKLQELRARALDLKAFYLDWKASHAK